MQAKVQKQLNRLEKYKRNELGRIIILEDYIEVLIKVLYKSPEQGYLGIDEIIRRFKGEYKIIGVYKKVEKVIGKYIDYLKNKLRRYKLYRLL